MIGFEQIRKQNNMSLSDVGNIIGTSRQFISKWERGEKKIPKKYYPKLEELFNTKSEYFTKELDDDEMFKI